jgi:lipid II:glycine glycyltransferase (peptidoglycan interpeptide bridge formation enzyme)
MFQVFARARYHQPEVWAVMDDRSAVLALLTPVRVTLMNGVMRRLTTRSVAYGGVLCQDTPEGKTALRLLLTRYSANAGQRTLFTELRNVHDATDLQSTLTGCGYTYEPHLNYLIDLNRSAEAVLQGIGPRTRKKIRKGLRAGRVRVSQVADRAGLAHWYDVLQATYDNARVPLADRSLFEAAFEVLQPKGLARFYLATVDDAPAACSVELPYRDTIYGWYGGSDRAYSDDLPNEMLIWHVLAWGANNGYSLYDFGGAGKPDEEYGVRDFKAKFGGEQVCYGRNTRVHDSARLALSKAGYRLYQGLKRLRPAQPTEAAHEQAV